MKLRINDSYHISDITRGDKPAYIEHLKEKQIYDQTLAIPYPYTEADADWWINHNIELVKQQGGRSFNWALRRSEDDYLIGGIGFLGFKLGESHTAELGYWLAKPYWNKGIMTEAVKVASRYGFKELGLARITAHVFSFNIGSAKVLENAGFQCEGVLRSHYKKDGKLFDGKIYAMLSSDVVVSPAPSTSSAKTCPSKHISIAIERSVQDVYAFVSNPENLPQWAAGLSSDIRKIDNVWKADSPMGEVTVKFTPSNTLGVLDHDVTLPSGERVHNPLRVLPNNNGSEVVFTLFRLPSMSEQDFTRDAAMVSKDLRTLKALLEK